MTQIQPKDLRIALFTGNYNYIRDGVAITLNRLVAYLLKREIAVLIFAPTTPEPAFEAVGELISVPSVPVPLHTEYRIALGMTDTAKVRLEQFNPNLFLLAAPDILGRRALGLAKAMNVPAVASFHTRYDTYLKFYGLGFLENWGRNYMRKFYRRCLRVYPPSQSMADELRSEGIAQNLEIWGRGVDSESFNPSRRSLAWRKSLHIEDDEIVVTFVSRLVKEKNTDILIKAFERLKLNNIALRVLIVGHGPEEPHMREALPDAIFTGFLQGEDLAQAYASSDIFFFPSESETFGNVTLEAMASGLPTVCADATGSRSLVVDGETGYLQSAVDENGFVERISELVLNAKLRQDMGKAARTRALEFNWDSILSKLLESFATVVNEQSAPE
jgi:phosphatidylinositol alpha 1,6-mannosyltransferase